MRLFGWLVSVVVLAGGAIALLMTSDLLPKWSVTTPPEVANCEVNIKDGLLAPSTYRRVDVISHDEPMADERAIERAAGIARRRPGEIGYESWKLAQAVDGMGKLQLRTVGIRYDSDNEAGVPVRGLGVCAFRVIDGKLFDVSFFSSDLDEAERTLALLKGGRPRTRPNFTCCL